MATASQPDQVLSGTWVDLTVALPGLVSASAFFQNPANGGDIAIVFGGADPTTLGISGVRLRPCDSFEGAAANVWAKSLEALGRVAITLL